MRSGRWRADGMCARGSPQGVGRNGRECTGGHGRLSYWISRRNGAGQTEATPGGGSAPLRRLTLTVGGGSTAVVGGFRGSVRSLGLAVVAAESSGMRHLAQEQQLVDLSKGPVQVLDGDAANEGGQVGGFVRRHSLQEERPIDGSRRQGLRRAERFAPGRWGLAGLARRGRGGRHGRWPRRGAAR
jgi:hypothetical protein